MTLAFVIFLPRLRPFWVGGISGSQGWLSSLTNAVDTEVAPFFSAYLPAQQGHSFHPSYPTPMCVCVCVCVCVLSCVLLFVTPPPGSSVHEISQARILESVAISSSRGSFWPRDSTCISHVSCISRHSLLLSHSWELCLDGIIYTHLQNTHDKRSSMWIQAQETHFWL